MRATQYAIREVGEGLEPEAVGRVELNLIPGPQPRPPAVYIAAIIFVFSAEFFSQGRLFIKSNKQMHAQGNGRDRGDGYRVSMAENDPEPDPSRRETHVHRIAYITIEAHNN